MLRSLEFATAALFLLLSTILLALWSWAVPDLWNALDVRIALATVVLTSMGLGWILSRGHDSLDPEPL